MTNRVGFKRLCIGLAVAAALSVGTAFAASPTVTDGGSAYWTARVNGSGFTSSGLFSTNHAYVLIENIQYDEFHNVVRDDYLGEWVNVSGWACSRIFCTLGGTFNYQKYMAGYQCGQRWAIAYDEASGLWSNWVQLDCA